MGSFLSSESEPSPFRASSASSQGKQKADKLREASRSTREEAQALSQRSQEAYHAGRHADAKKFSTQAKEAHLRADAIAAQAAELTFKLHNESQPPDTMDLHGLTVKEALQKVDARMAEDKAKGADHLILIVGAGKHSPLGIAKIKPAVEDLLVRHKANFVLGEPNEGCVTVRYDGYKETWWEYLTGWVPSTCVVS